MATMKATMEIYMVAMETTLEIYMVAISMMYGCLHGYHGDITIEITPWQPWRYPVTMI